MRRIFLLLAALALVLTACASAEPTATPEPTAPPVSALEGFPRGTVADGVYRSAFAGFALRLPDYWEAATEEQLQKAAADRGSEHTVLDVYCYDPMTGENFNVTYEDLAAFGVPDLDTLSDEEYKNIAVASLASDEMQPTEVRSETVTLGGVPWCKAELAIRYPAMDVTVTVYDYFRVVDGVGVVLSAQREMDTYFVQ